MDAASASRFLDNASDIVTPSPVSGLSRETSVSSALSSLDISPPVVCDLTSPLAIVAASTAAGASLSSTLTAMSLAQMRATSTPALDIAGGVGVILLEAPFAPNSPSTLSNTDSTTTTDELLTNQSRMAASLRSTPPAFIVGSAEATAGRFFDRQHSEHAALSALKTTQTGQRYEPHHLDALRRDSFPLAPSISTPQLLMSARNRAAPVSIASGLDRIQQQKMFSIGGPSFASPPAQLGSYHHHHVHGRPPTASYFSTPTGSFIATGSAAHQQHRQRGAPQSAGVMCSAHAGPSTSAAATSAIFGGSALSFFPPCSVAANNLNGGATTVMGGRMSLPENSGGSSASSVGQPLGGGLQRNKSRTSFASSNIDDENEKAFHMKHMSDIGMAKHLHTEQVMSKHTLKGKMSKFQRLFDKAFSLVNLETEDAIVEGAGIVTKVMINAWVVPKIGHDLAYGLCDYLRDMNYFDLLLHYYLSPDSKQRVRIAAGRALEECLSSPNRDHLVKAGLIEDLVNVAKSFKEGEELRIGVSLFESLFKQSAQTNAKLIEMGALDYVLSACKATTMSQVFRHAALALANVSMYSENECQQKMISKNVPDWLFLLASSQDDVTRYYACLAICALVSNKEIEAAVIKSGTLSLVEPFLLAHKPNDFADSDYRHNQGRPKEWLEKLLPMLSAKRREPRSMAAFHFAMEAGIKKDQDQLEVFEEIGAIEALKQVASYPEEVGPKYAAQSLEIIGAEIPYKLIQQVPLWSVEDVQYWVTQIGFEEYAKAFHEQKVDGDLLLLLSDDELKEDVGMRSGLKRKRFMRELDSLKMSADYSSVDESHLDRFLVSISPQLSLYTYQLLEKGADRDVLTSVTDEILRSDLFVRNPLDRIRLLQALDESKHIDDMEVAILSRHIDIFISYRRSTGNQLASLIKVLLQLRGYKVFIDVDRLYAGKFDLSLLKNIQAAKHFVLVLTPNALQKCIGDDQCHDWVHKELLCALEHNKNVIPIFDPQFDWPDEHLLPQDIRVITRFNGVRWVHEYQDACVDKLEKFIKGELNINRGFFPHGDRGKRMVGFRSNSSKQNSNPGTQSGQITPSTSIADGLIDTLYNHRSRSPSNDEFPAQNSHDQYSNLEYNTSLQHSVMINDPQHPVPPPISLNCNNVIFGELPAP